MFVCNKLLFATLSAVVYSGRIDKVLFDDVLPFENDGYFGSNCNDGFWYNDIHVDVCVAMLINECLLFEKNGFIYPSIRAHSFIYYCTEHEFDFFEFVPFLTLVTKALKNANKNFIGI